MGSIEQQRYRVELYSQKASTENDTPLEILDGVGALPETLFLDGFTSVREIDLRPHWKVMHKENMHHHLALCDTFETFEKFGEVMQQKNTYQLLLEIKR